MANELYGLLESQIEALQDARVYALAVCEWVGRLFVGVRDNRLEVGPYRHVLPAISELLDPHKIDSLVKRLETIGFLIEKARIPVEVPVSPSGRNMSIHSMKKSPSAHRGAAMLWNTVHGFLSGKVLELCPELGLALDFRDAASKLVDRHWEALRHDLADVVQFDCEALRDAINREAQAAMEVCNASLISAVAGRKEHGGRKGERSDGAGSTPPAARPEQGEGNGGAAWRNTSWLGCLVAVRNELDTWGDFEQSESWTEHYPEAIKNDHPLWQVVVALQQFYPKKRLPKLTGALDAWADLCKY